MIVKRWSERENLGSRAPGLVSSFWEKKSTLTGQRGEDRPLQFQNHCWAKHKGGSTGDRAEGGAWFVAAGVVGVTARTGVLATEPLKASSRSWQWLVSKVVICGHGSLFVWGLQAS